MLFLECTQGRALLVDEANVQRGSLFRQCILPAKVEHEVYSLELFLEESGSVGLENL